VNNIDDLKVRVQQKVDESIKHLHYDDANLIFMQLKKTKRLSTSANKNSRFVLVDMVQEVLRSQGLSIRWNSTT
jgi:hypothetical protein